MAARRTAQALGFDATARVVVIHADDVGMCHGTLEAFDVLARLGAISSASTMVPCGWFPSVAAWCQQHASIADVGVHLTVNSEWAAYRWRPVAAMAVPTLRDEAGFFLRSPEQVQRHGDPDDVHAELTAQIGAARASGIDVTHADSHIFSLRHPRLIETYARVSREQKIPGALVRRPDPEIERPAFGSAEIDAYYRVIDEAERDGVPLFESWVDLPLNEPPERRIETGRRVLDGLPPGVSALLFHPVVDTPEVRAISSDWPARVADFELLRSEEWARAMEAAGVQVVGMRAIRDAFFGPPAVAGRPSDP